MANTTRSQGRLDGASQAKQTDFFLPDFCQVQSVFLVILIAELLAVVFTLLNVSGKGLLWNLLGLYSMSIQVISLVSVATLCLLRPYLAKLSDLFAGVTSLSLILLTTFLFNLGVIKFYWWQPLDLGQSDQSYLMLQNLLIAGLIGAVALRYFYLLQQYRRQVALESAARLQALQARIRPHFLFNSMNVIASLTRIDPRKAEMAIQDLSDLFRATLKESDDLIPLSQEIENGRRYLALEQLRLGERMQVEETISEDALQVLVPPLSIQPLLENAVYHGIQRLPDGGKVKINAQIDPEHNQLTLTVENPTLAGKRGGGHGIALNNIRERLAMLYPGRGQLLKQREADRYRVTLVIPVSRG